MASFVFAPPFPPTEQFFKFDESDTFVLYIRQYATKLYQKDTSRVYAMNVINQLNNEPTYEMARTCSQELVECLDSEGILELDNDGYDDLMDIFVCFNQNVWFKDCLHKWKLCDYFFDRVCTPEEHMHIQMCSDMVFDHYMCDDLYYKAHRKHIRQDITNVLNSKVFNHLYIDVFKKTENNAQKMLLAFVNIFLHARSVVIEMRNSEKFVDDNYDYTPLFEEMPAFDELPAVDNGFPRYRVLEPVAHPHHNQGYENDGDENEDFPLPPQEGDREFDLAEARQFVDQVLREYREEQEEARINDNSDLDEDLDPIPILE